MKRILEIALGAIMLVSAAKAEAQVLAPIPFRAAALTNTAVQVKASAGEIRWATCGNANASSEYLQVYDVAGAVTVGTTTPTLSIPIPVGGGFFAINSQYFNAIKIAATTTAAGGTAPGTALDCSAGFN
jgi:hypothetical protein